MARIDFPEGPVPFSPLLPRRQEDGKKTGKGKGIFRASLDRALEESGTAGAAPGAEEAFSDEAIEGLLDRVHEAGDGLKDNPGIDAVHAYKKAVRDFIHHVVNHAYEVEEKVSGGNILKRKKFYRIAVIDEALERLAAEILKSQRDRLEILRRIDEINGMLVDLVR